MIDRITPSTPPETPARLQSVPSPADAPKDAEFKLEAVDTLPGGVPATPPTEVLYALDRAQSVIAELASRQVSMQHLRRRGDRQDQGRALRRRRQADPRSARVPRDGDAVGRAAHRVALHIERQLDVLVRHADLQHRRSRLRAGHELDHPQLMSIEAQPKVRLQQKQVGRAGAPAGAQGRADAAAEPLAPGRGRSATRERGTTSRRSTRPTRRRWRRQRTGGAAAGGYSLQIVSLARAAQLTQGNGGGGSPITSASADDTLHIAVGTTTPVSVDVSIEAGDSLQTIADKINEHERHARLRVAAERQARALGQADRRRQLDRGHGRRGSRPTSASPRRRRPPNADFWVGTTHYTDRTSNVVKDVMAGVELTLRGTTGTGTVSVVVGSPAADTDAIKTKVQAFVDQYNSTIDFVRGKLNEDRVVNPTTDADRAKGVLRGDPGLTSLLSSLRASVSDVFSGRPSDTDQLDRGRASRPARPPARARSTRTRSRASSRSTRPSSPSAWRRASTTSSRCSRRSRAATTPRACRSGSTASSRRGSRATARTRRS